MEHTVRVNWVGAVAALVAGVGVSVVASTAMAARAYRQRIAQIERADQSVTVKGYARAPLRADTAVWSIQVKGRGATLPEAFAVLNAGQARAVAFLQGQGFGPESVGLSPIDTNEHMVTDDRGRATMEVAGYTMTRTITVSTPQVERVARASSEVTTLLEEGVSLISMRPQFTCSTLNDVKVDVIGRASADARARAEEIAAKAGARVAEVRTAQQGVLQVVTPGSTEVSGYGIYDTGTIDKEATIVMTVTFGLDAP